MKFFVKFLTRAYMSVMILFNWFPSKCQCDTRNSTVMTVPVNDTNGRYFRKFTKSLNIHPPLIIDLRHRAYKYLPTKILRHNETEILDLEDNRLTNLPSDLANLTKLEYINLVDNKISDISDVSAINELPNLESLALSGNPLKSLEGLRIGSLLTLEAGYCEIEEIGDLFIDSLPSLKTLNLTGNPLGKMRKLISDNLTDLVLKNCRLTELPYDAFEGLTNLEFLDLRGNELSTMPDAIFSRNNNLVNLSLGNNTLELIKTIWFDRKTNMRKLDLSRNAIISINVTVFEELLALDELDLSDNRIVIMPMLRTVALKINLTKNSIVNKRFWDLSDMTRVRILDMSRNRLAGDCDEFISTSLRTLDLSYNNLTRLRRESFSSLPNLMDLNLEGNQLSRGIDSTIFNDNKILVDIELKYNPWGCNCTDLYPLYIYLAMGQRTETSSLVCHNPERVKGNTWWHVCAYDWKQHLTNDEHHIDVSKTWMIAISAVFGICLALGTIIYITYTFKKNRSRGIS